MKTAEGVKPVQNPATARKKYTPAAVLMKRFTFTPSRLFTSPVNSQMVMPVNNANRAIMLMPFKKHVTMMATNRMPVMALTMKFFIISGLVISFSSLKDDYMY